MSPLSEIFKGNDCVAECTLCTVQEASTGLSYEHPGAKNMIVKKRSSELVCTCSPRKPSMGCL